LGGLVVGIAKCVAEAFEKIRAGDPEGALMQICAAIEATATAEYGKEGRGSYKDFLRDNLGLITKVGFGLSILNLNLGYVHPRIKTATPGLCSFEDILYHAVRCGLYHQASLPSDLRFHDEPAFKIEDELLVLPAKLVLGLVIAVVVAPINKDEKATEGHYGLDISGYRVPLNKLWGRRAELLELYRTMDAIQKDRP
jgi:hypothetical protein